jgi:hypothetical protein
MGEVAIAAKALFILATCFTRLSLLIFYHRLVSETNLKFFRRTIQAAMVFNFGVGAAFVPLSIWLCVPLGDYWKFGGHCLNEGTVILASGIASSVADLLTTALPIPLVLRMKLPLAQKVIVVVLLSLGFSVTIAGAIR